MTYPHADDTAQRDTLDNGFSSGWGKHFLPAEEHVIDCHMHIDGKEPWLVKKGLDQLFWELDAHRLDQVIVMDGGPGSVDWFGQVAKTDRRFNFMIWMKPDKPNVDFLKKAHDCGCVGVKLHNHQVMRGMYPADIWETPEWQKVFAEAEKLGMPVLWHATQIEGRAAYSGEGLGNTLSRRREQGETLSNAELLDRFLGIVDKYKGITFIGAHLLYVGDATLDTLFAAHENLAVDTSMGYFLRFGDTMLEEDIKAGHDFVIKWSDRILFGTDNKTSAAHSNPVCFEAFRCHVRYMHALHLPQDALDNVMWKNAQRIFRLKECEGWMTATTRP